MPDTTAKIRAKGLDATGITEELAEKMYAHKGKRYMGIVELQVDEIHEKTDGKRRVDLILTLVEPATDARLEDHLRELTRVCYFNRQTDTPLPLSDADGPDPKIEDVIRNGEALVERDEDGDPVGFWDGDAEALLDQAQATLAQLDDSDGPAYDADTPDERPVEDVNVTRVNFSGGQ